MPKSTPIESHLRSRIEFHQELIKQKDAHIEELSNTILGLRDNYDVLRRERDGWKASSGREGVHGFVLGAIVFIIIGVYIGHSF